MDKRLNQGIELFNTRKFFESHEALEDLWREGGTFADLYQGIIKAAAAFYHLKRGNFYGAKKKLSEGLIQLRPYGDTAQGIDLRSFVDDLEAALTHIIRTEAGEEPLDLDRIPQIHLDQE
ncbi:MAG: DUF309 domain-containing protein [Candidatus Bipolaricaulia bacterium]